MLSESLKDGSGAMQSPQGRKHVSRQRAPKVAVCSSRAILSSNTLVTSRGSVVGKVSRLEDASEKFTEADTDDARSFRSGQRKSHLASSKKMLDECRQVVERAPTYSEETVRGRSVTLRTRRTECELAYEELTQERVSLEIFAFFMMF